ncbi:MAG: hypothetical protein WC347_02820 [Smithellaceae bacterium]
MDQDKFNTLLGKTNKQEETTLKVLYNAVVKCVNEMNAGSAPAVKSWEKTRSSYEQYANELWNKYFPPETTAPASPEYKTIQDVIRRVNEMGFKLAKSAYNHAERGLLRPNELGIYTQDIIDKYIVQANLKKKDGSRREKQEKSNSERQNAETRRINAQAEREEFKLQRERGLYVPKESFERELSYRAMVFKMDGDSFCRSEAGAIIELVSGDKDKIPDLQEFLLERFHKWLARYAADKEFTVPQPAAAEMISDTDDENSELVDGE